MNEKIEPTPMEIIYQVLAPTLAIVRAQPPRTKIPKRVSIPLEKITRDLIENKLHEGEQNVKVGSVSVLVELSLDRSFDAFDLPVFSAVVSIYEQGNFPFTLETLYRCMTGNNEARVTKQIAEKIRKSLEKMALTLISIDWSEEFKKYKGSTDSKARLKGTLIEVRSLEIEKSNKKYEYFQLLGEPILYTYAKYKRQILTLDAKYLDVPLRRDPNTISLEYWLLIRIAAISRNPKMSNHITFASIYEKANADSKIERQRTRNKVFTMLDYWKELHFIDYKTVGKYHAIAIERPAIERPAIERPRE